MKRIVLTLSATLILSCQPLPGASSDGGSNTGGGTSSGGDASDGGQTGGGIPNGPALTEAEKKLIVDRPYRTVTPKSYDGLKAYPLLVLLHGFTGNGTSNDEFFGMSPAIEKRGVLLATPNGTKNGAGISFWNATDACCNFDNKTVDDVAYLTTLVKDMSARYKVDPKRVYFAGHSNGGFMSYRMACEKANIVAGIVSLSGAMFNDPAKCQPSGPVAAAQVHGTTDEVINFNGGTLPLRTVPYPSARTSIGFWAKRNGCSDAFEPAETKADFIDALSQTETTKQRFSGCPAGLETELWTITGARHTPTYNASFAENVLDFLLSHSKP